MADISSFTFVDFVVILVGTAFLVVTSGKIVVYTASYIRGDHDYDPVDEVVGRANTVIGICECILVVMFIFADSFTGLAVIFAAEGVVSLQSDNDDYYQFRFLAGTLVNFTYSIVVSLTMRLLVDLL